MKKKNTTYTVEVKSLKGRSLLMQGTSTDKVCHIKTLELEPGIKLAYAIDAFEGKLYVDTSALLTW